ncbi:thiamine transport system permease protein [Dongia mobilis]|uniref:Thiamine transport system permease protein ThiP n=1 Tax=Dongia mobilis TaxID=578943 RepID=A0A4R6WXP3_9PROT|nr:thiamine/thiamine pyrophosphate ABC transporter permease [Dongia mobilis]TDQ84203.1 thiamine transport system permease protein [Dongia mobilis]
MPLLARIGLVLAAALAAATILVFVLLLGAGGAGAPQWDYIGRVLAFTFQQALLSTLLALLGAMPMTRALARRAVFPGRSLLLRLCALPLVMPTIVGIFGVVAVYGGNGYLAAAANALGAGWRPGIYGLTGILIAHVFFNLPLAIRLLLPAYAAIPAETWRLTAQLGMGGGDIFRVIEWPLLRQRLPSVALVVFMLCFSTFAVALTLGGGPRATTLEVAIYQALRFDFDLQLGAVLALIQAACCAAGAWAVWHLGRDMALGQTARLVAPRFDGQRRGARLADAAVILLGTLFVALPLLALVQKGLAGLPAAAAPASLMRAALVSLGLGLGGGLLATAIGYALATARQAARDAGHRQRALVLALIGRLGLFVSPMVIGTGIFLAASGQVDLYRFAALGVIGLSAVMALPFVLSVLEPALADSAARHDRLCRALGIHGWHRFRAVDWPTLRKPIATALALSSVLAMGDLGAIALFGHKDMVNLTLLLYHQLGAYRLDGAAATALILLVLALLFYWSIERWVGGRELH